MTRLAQGSASVGVVRVESLCDEVTPLDGVMVGDGGEVTAQHTPRVDV
jgi:hypothetical protein